MRTETTPTGQAPVDVLTVLDAEIADAMDACKASHGSARLTSLYEARALVADLISAAQRADGNERPNRPERGIGFDDHEWKIFLRGWDMHARSVFDSGLRASLVQCGAIK
jgi:hypothetical protein